VYDETDLQSKICILIADKLRKTIFLLYDFLTVYAGRLAKHCWRKRIEESPKPVLQFA